MISWLPEAVADVAEIIENLFVQDPEVAFAVQDKILEKVEWLETHTIAGGRVIGLGKDYRQAFAIKTTYRIIYKVIGEDSIRVIMVRYSRRQKPTAGEIAEREP